MTRAAFINKCSDTGGVAAIEVVTCGCRGDATDSGKGGDGGSKLLAVRALTAFARLR
jgi:hypothetical protein